MDNNSLLHPVTRWRLAQTPPISITQISERASVDRTSLTKVEHGDRERLDPDACARIVAKFPQIDLLELVTWKWSARGRAIAQRVLRDLARQTRHVPPRKKALSTHHRRAS